MWTLSVLAQGGRGDNDPLRSPEVIWGTAGLALALLAGALVVWLVDRWRKRMVAETADSTGELTEFRAMYERGEITEEEYARLRTRVAERVKAAVLSPTPPSGTGQMPPALLGQHAPHPPPAPAQPNLPTDPGTPANPPPPV